MFRNLFRSGRNTEYDFECYVKTEKLETAARRRFRLLIATDGSVLVVFCDGAWRHERLDSC